MLCALYCHIRRNGRTKNIPVWSNELNAYTYVHGMCNKKGMDKEAYEVCEETCPKCSTYICRSLLSEDWLSGGLQEVEAPTSEGGIHPPIPVAGTPGEGEVGYLLYIYVFKGTLSRDF